MNWSDLDLFVGTPIVGGMVVFAVGFLYHLIGDFREENPASITITISTELHVLAGFALLAFTFLVGFGLLVAVAYGKFGTLTAPAALITGSISLVYPLYQYANRRAKAQMEGERAWT